MPAFKSRSVSRIRIFTIVSSLVLSLLTGLISAPSASAAACSNTGAVSGDYTITPSHGQVFYIDSGVTPRLDAAFVGYRIVNSNATAKRDLWVKLSSFRGGTQISLANPNDELQQIATLEQGSANAKTAYFLLKASGTSTTTDHLHTMELYQGNPNRGGSLIYDCDFTFTAIEETIKASANKVQTITISNSSPELGSIVDVTVTGTTGQPGNGDNGGDKDILWVTPAGFSTWPTNALRLERTSIVLDQNGDFTTTNDQNTYVNQLLIRGIKTMNLGSTTSKLNSSSQYRAVYSFRVIGQAASAFKVAPVAQISSGTQYKHSDTNSTASGAFPSLNLSSVSTSMSVTKKISPTSRVSNISVASNVATLTLSEAHGLSSNDVVYVTDAKDASNSSVSYLNGRFTATVVDATTITIPVSGSDISSQAATGYVFKKSAATETAIIPFEVKVTSNTSVAVDEIVDVPDAGFSFVTSSARVKDVDRTSFTNIADPVLDSTETSLSPRPRHFVGPFAASSTVPVILRYQMTVSANTSATNSNTLYAKSGAQIVGTNSSANPKILITSTVSGLGSVSETVVSPPPTVTTENVTALGATTATLAGTADPNGNTTAIKFQWGTSSTLATSTDATSTPSTSNSGSTITMSSNLTGLNANTIYYYRTVITYTPAGGSETVVYGDILSFRTNLVGSTAQTLTWGTTFSTFDLRTTTSTTQNSTVSGTSYTGGNIYASSGLLVDVVSDTPSVCTVSTSSTFDVNDNETSVVYTIDFLTTGTCTLTASQAGNTTYAAATSITKNITVVRTHVVTFDVNTGSGSPSVNSVTQSSAGASVTLAGAGTMLKTGYTFGGWNTAADGNGTNYNASSSYTPTANITLYAKWNINTYLVTYNANTATGGTVPVDSSSPYNYGSTVTVLGNTGTLAKTGYTFAGWNTAANGSGTSRAAASTFTLGDANVILYAQWSPGTYTLTYDANGAGSGSVPAQQSFTTGGAAITISGNTGTLAKNTFDFHGWYSNPNGTGGISYSPGSSLTISSNTTLYAHWVAAGSKTITFDKNDGSNTTGSQTAGAPTVISSNSTLRERTGYTFAGWDTAADGSGADYVEGTTSYDFLADITLYAKWTINTYTVSYDGNGSTSGAAPSSVTQNYNTTVTVAGSNTLQRTGYTFAGWDTAADGSGTDRAENSTFTLGSANVTLYAQWTQNQVTYTITYSTQGSNSGTAPANTTGNGSVNLRNNSGSLAKSNSTFRGWNTQPNCGGTDYSAGASFTLSANITLYPCFDMNNNNGGGGGNNDPAPQPVVKQKAAVVWKNPNAIITTTSLTNLELNAVGTVPSAVTPKIADPAAPEKLPDAAPKLNGKYVYVPVDPKIVVSNPNPGTAPTGIATGGAPVIGQGAVLAAGTHKLKVIFVPDDTNYEPAETIVEIVVKPKEKVKPTINWTPPAPIVEGTPLSNKELNAKTEVPGKYEYVQTDGQILPNGKQVLKVRFIPDDLTSYEIVETQVEIEVKKPINPKPTPIITPANVKDQKPIIDASPQAKTEVKEVGKGLQEVIIGPNLQVQVNPALNFSGKTQVVVKVTDDGQTVDVVVPVTILPLAPEARITQPTAFRTSNVTWNPSPNAIAYDVLVEGKKVCETSATSCAVDGLIGPKTKVEVLAKGNDETVAPIVPAVYKKPESPILATVKNFATAKFDLRPSVKRELREFAAEVKAAGFTRLVVQGHTDIRGGIDNTVLSRNRAQTTINYLKKFLPDVKFKIGYFASTKPAADNSTKEGLAANRRVEIALW